MILVPRRHVPGTLSIKTATVGYPIFYDCDYHGYAHAYDAIALASLSR